MTLPSDEQNTFHDLEATLRTLLPETYQDRYEDVLPVSMGSTGLKYGSDGKVAWHQIWGSFCDLAMAGGPPHKGKLLQAAREGDIEAQPERYRDVVQEICRGITMTTGLFAEPSPAAGWIAMHCTSAAMAGWLGRSIVMENVSASFRGLRLYLPAGPDFRLDKEIKNVVTATAKTCHYWLEHTSAEQQDAIAHLFTTMESESPLVQLAPLDQVLEADTQRALHDHMAASIFESTGLRHSDQRYSQWLGFDCGEVRAAIWMMRVLVASNVFARREETLVFVPVNPTRDPEGTKVIRAVIRAYGFAVEQNIFPKPSVTQQAP